MTEKSYFTYTLNSRELNCAAISYAALLDPFKPSEEHIALIQRRPKIKTIALCLAREYFTHGFFCFIHCLDKDESSIPSNFFAELNDDSQQDPYGLAKFSGGLVRMNYKFIKTGELLGHVVAIKDINSQGEVTLINSAPIDPTDDFVSRIPLNKIDSLMTHVDVSGETRAVGFTTMPLNHPEVKSSVNADFVRNQIEDINSDYEKAVKAI